VDSSVDELPVLDAGMEQPVLGGPFSKEGEINVYRRSIHWRVDGYLKWFSWRYKATARDKVSGVTGSASGKKSGKGAVEDAVTDLFRQLIARGIVPALPKLTPATRFDPQEIVADDNVAELQASEAVGGFLRGPFSKSGELTVLGRTVRFKVSGYLKGLKWRYRATVTDATTGISGSSSNLKSGKGAVETAVKDCFAKLVAAGLIPIPSLPPASDNEGDNNIPSNWP